MFKIMCWNKKKEMNSGGFAATANRISSTSCSRDTPFVYTSTTTLGQGTGQFYISVLCAEAYLYILACCEPWYDDGDPACGDFNGVPCDS